MNEPVNASNPDTKTHQISRQLADFREADRCCPVCNDGTRIVMRHRVYTDDEGNVTGVGGTYWVCAEHDTDYDHYQYSPGGGKKGAKPRETVGASVPQRFLPPKPEVPSARVVKRDRVTGTITPLKVA